MNKPVQSITPDDDLGALDEHGQQIWTDEEAAAIARMEADPAYHEGLRRAEEDIAAGRVFTHEQVVAMSAERRRRWLAAHKL